MPLTGELSNLKVHNHHRLDHSAFIFSASGDQLGLHKKEFASRFAAQAVPTNMSAHAITRHIDSFLSRSCYQRPCPKMVCHTNAGIERISSADDFIKSGIYGREPKALCTAWSFKQGDPAAFVVMHTAAPESMFRYDIYPGDDEQSWNHAHFWLTFVQSDPSPLSRHYNLQGSHSLHNFHHKRSPIDIWSNYSSVGLLPSESLFEPEDVKAPSSIESPYGGFFLHDRLEPTYQGRMSIPSQ